MAHPARRASGGEYGRVGDGRLVVWCLIIISATQPDLIGNRGASCSRTDMKVASSLVKNRQHFPCRIVISQHSRGGGAGKVRGGNGGALQSEGVGRHRPTNRRERADGDAVANRDGGDANGNSSADGCGDRADLAGACSKRY